ncbi:hypothetical protein GCM10027168_01320 [Streptomyces capparidis]
MRSGNDNGNGKERDGEERGPGDRRDPVEHTRMASTADSGPEPPHPGGDVPEGPQDQDAHEVRGGTDDDRDREPGPAGDGGDSRGESVRGDDGRGDDDRGDGRDEGPERAVPGGDARACRPSLESEEEVLRRLLHDTVRGVEPTPGSLEHLRRAIPARRAHRRQAMMGLAASVLVAVAAVPALIHTTTASDSASNAAHESETHPAKEVRTAAPTARPSASAEREPESASPRTEESAGPSKSATGPDTDPVQPDATGLPDGDGGAGFDTAVPMCTADRLGAYGVEVGTADGEGRVYGAFHLVNASSGKCSVDGAGDVGATAQGGADPARVLTSPHTAGDPASGLSDVAQQRILLLPGQTFTVRFGWVPESGTTGCAATSDPSGGDGSAEGPAGEESPSSDPDPPEPGSVVVAYTPDGGGPAQTGTVTGVCAGTVYWTPPEQAA